MASVNMDEVYRDQGGRGFIHPGIQITSFYTPTGIKRIDTRFGNRIRSFGNGEPFIEYSYSYSECRAGKPPKREVEMIWSDSYESLKKDIEENPHLHPTIKENLLFNLENYTKLPTANVPRLTKPEINALYASMSKQMDAEYVALCERTCKKK
jgi:hypothetical protein